MNPLNPPTYTRLKPRNIGSLLAVSLIALTSMLVSTGCGDSRSSTRTSSSSYKPYQKLVDLDKVSLALDETFVELDSSMNEGNKEDEDIPMVNETFLKVFASNLKANLGMSIAVKEMQDSSIIGYLDKNLDGNWSSSETKLFEIVFDASGERIVIKDSQATENNRSYRRSSGGFFFGYMIGRMGRKQRSAGIDAKRYSNLRESPKGYYQTAETKNRSSYDTAKRTSAEAARRKSAEAAKKRAASKPSYSTTSKGKSYSARSSGGSRSFSSGK